MAEIAGDVGSGRIGRPMAAAGSLPRVRVGALHLTLPQLLIGALVLLYVAKGVVLTFVFPPFSGHDETAHYSYVRTVATEWRVPTLTQYDDPSQGIVIGNAYRDLLPAELYRYCRYTLQWWCDPNHLVTPEGSPVWVASWGRDENNRQRLEANGVQYAANHPPLYYVLMAPVYVVSDHFGASTETRMYLLRLAAIPLGLLIVLLAFLTVRLIFPRDTFMLITVPSFVALQTQVSYEATMVNNDILALAIFSWVLYLVVRAVRDRFPDRTAALIGVAIGLGMLTKSTSVTAVAFVGLAMLTLISFRSRAAIRGSLPRFIRTGVLIGLPAAALAAPWYIHMYQTYGNLTALPQVLELQRYWNNPSGTFFGLFFNLGFAKDRFAEMWGEYGWKVLPFDPLLMHIIAVPTLIAVAGFILFSVRTASQSIQAGRVTGLTRWQVWAIAVLFMACAVGYLATVQFGVSFALTQARYFFPVINAFAILLMLGLRTVIPTRWLPAGSAALIVGMVALNGFVMTSYVVPFYWM